MLTYNAIFVKVFISSETPSFIITSFNSFFSSYSFKNKILTFFLRLLKIKNRHYAHNLESMPLAAIIPLTAAPTIPLETPAPSPAK